MERKNTVLGLAVLGAVFMAVERPMAQAAGPLVPVMTGLNNPYGLAFGPDGSLYVAEGGTGNNGLTTGPGFVDGAGTMDYFGDTSSVSKLANGIQTRVINGLPSLGPAVSGEASGLQGLTFDGSGNLYGVFGLGSIEANRTQLVSDVLAGGASSTNAGLLGQVVRLDVTGNTATAVSDLVPYETANYMTNNKDGTVVEANPYAIIALPAGGFAVSDGGGNVVLKVAAGGGSPTLLTALAAQTNTTGIGGPTYQAVPTGLALNASGGLFVGELTGFPFPVGGASVFGLDQTTGLATPFASGFTTITGIAFGPNGDLYVLDLTTNGLAGPPSDTRIFDFNPTTNMSSLLADLGPGSTYSAMIMGPDNALYLSDQGTGVAGTGEVLRLSLAAPEPSTVLLVGTGLLLTGRRRRVLRAM